ncbi:histidinol dehydrogenase [Pelotomaculum terephthalicicum JT]|uniref:histidinol dehydrogenase n=1 Tax=Pelotomaculum terephthalicicum TaxID=206393 RepID=UPI0009CF79E8|nr:histidinol dehydrogenase [Pelotomaculum terephthalicicum]MCG9967825.1 histidinol dehydrogenase [Pelotomaculum terephthalicicum JT]OPY62360.1 MAG: Histidinol dehydrogenase [Pelotomaculum sp. PtaU1.Bin065]
MRHEIIKIVKAGDSLLDKIFIRKTDNQEKIAARVAGIIASVRAGGDEAVCEFNAEFGGSKLAPGELKVANDEVEAAYRFVGDSFLEALRLALHNITAYHKRQLQQSWFETGGKGIVLGQMVRPLRRVGIYVPGGKASYPSSVLMNAVPARVAGVQEIAMVTPPAGDGKIDPHTLVAAAEAGVSEIYKIGGAQAIAALAYGTAVVPKVDKITGPGNIYVTLAKQQVYGQVDIDMLAGPSEVLVIADDTATPSFVAADLLSQAEHDEMASVVLLTPCGELALKVQAEVFRQASLLSRREIIEKSLENYGAIVVTENLEQAFDLANHFAPEHLELMITEPFNWLNRVENAGAVFLGRHTPEPVGDYVAGPNHVLPTGGTARFYSALGVDAFIKKTSLLSYTPAALNEAGGAIVKLAEVEGLSAHANAVRVRMLEHEAIKEDEGC